MSKIILILCFAISVLSSSQLIAAPQKKKVSIEANVKADEAKDNRFTLSVAIEVQEGWHIYGTANEDSPTTIRLELPDGIKQVGDWSEPEAEPYGDSFETTIYNGRAKFNCTLEIGNASREKGAEVGISVDYQACNEKFCNPPTSKTFAVEIPKLGNSDGLFEPPIRLMNDSKPLDHKARFPSPAIYDVDGDGVDELLVGSLRGTLDVFENLNKTGKGDPVWSERKNLRDSSGETIKVKNW